MKRTMQYIVAMAAVLWMAMPQVKAQELKEDHDPGIMYVMRNEGMHIPFEEGNEWEITFTAIDTLGNEYYSPVGIEIKGGVDNDSTYVVMQTVDSILMYQPAPVMQPGVFVITEEYFPYIAQVDSNTTIHFNVGIPLALPVVGQKVVCNIFEEPLRVGFMGTVLEMNQSATEIIMVCDPKIERIKDFYQYLIYSGFGGRTTEGEQRVNEISRVQRVRRNTIVNAPAQRIQNEFVAVKDPDFTLGPFSMAVSYGGELAPHVTASITGSIGMTVSGSVNVFTAVNEQKGMIINAGLSANLTGELAASVNKDIAIPRVGQTFESPWCPFNSSYKGTMGLYVNAKGKASLSTSFNLVGGKVSFAFLEDVETNETDIQLGFKFDRFEWKDKLAFTLAASIGLRVGISGKAEVCGDKYKFEQAMNLLEVGGTTKLDLIDLFTGEFKETPEELKSVYRTFSSNNDAYLKALGGRIHHEVTRKGFTYKNTASLDLFEYHLPLEPSSSSSKCKYAFKNESIGDTRKTTVELCSYEDSFFPADISLWTYDETKKEWHNKELLGETGILDGFSFVHDTYLKMGETYSLYPVYKMDLIYPMTDRAIAENVYVPYIINIKEPDLKIETVTLKAELCEAAVSDMKENTEIGFEYKDVSEKKWSKVEAVRNGREITAEIPNPGYDFAYKHDVRAYYTIDGKTSYSEVLQFEPLSHRTPILEDVSEIRYSSATFSAEISATLSSEYGWLVGFEYENTTTGEKKTIEDNCKGTIGIFSLTATDLQPMTTYNVRAYTRGGETKNYSRETKTFSTPAPIYDLNAKLGYSTADGFYADLTATILKNIYDNNQDLKFYVAKDKNKLAETDIKGLDVENITEVGDEMLISFKAKNLEQKTTYYFRVGAIYQDPEQGVSLEIGSETAQFKTDDGYGITLKDAVVKSNTATVEATVSQYIVDEVNRGNPYTIRFYYGTSSTKVKNRTSQFVEASISSTKVKATIKDLEEETKYYYAAVLYMIEEEGASEVKSFTTPTIFQIETKDAVVEDAMVTLKATISDAALAEMKSENYNTIYPAFDLVTKEHESDLKQGTASANVTRITDLTQDGVNISVDVYLEPGTEYCYRALIYVDGKEYYGATKSFKTLEYDGGLIPLVRKYRTNASAPWVPIVVKPEEKHLAIPLKELFKE